MYPSKRSSGDDSTDQEARPARFAELSAAPPCVADGFARIDVALDEHLPGPSGPIRPGRRFEIGHRGVALGGSVELPDHRAVKHRLKRFRHVLSEAVAAGNAHVMRALERMFGLIEQVAAELADVEDVGGPVRVDVVPESGSTELSPERKRRAGDERGTESAPLRGAVVERQRRIDDVSLSRIVQDEAEAVGRGEKPEVRHGRRLGEPRRARCVEVCHHGVGTRIVGTVRRRSRSSVELRVDGRRVRSPAIRVDADGVLAREERGDRNARRAGPRRARSLRQSIPRVRR